MIYTNFSYSGSNHVPAGEIAVPAKPLQDRAKRKRRWSSEKTV
jgi:hypothetical protein